MSTDTFLKSVEAMNDKANCVRLAGVLEPLVHSFWDYATISNAIAMRPDWDVPEHLIPFYGDWHSLFCLDQYSGAVVALNDARDELCRWASSEEFLASLEYQEKTSDPPDSSVKVEIWLDPDLLKR